MEEAERRRAHQHAEIVRTLAEAKSDLADEVKSETADLGWTLEEFDETVRQGFLRLDHHLDRVQAEVGARLDRIERHLKEGPRAKAAREDREQGERAYVNGWVDEALESFQNAEVKNYEDFSVHFQLADLYAELGNDGKAIEYYEKTAKYARPYSRNIAAEALLGVAGLRERQGDLESAYTCATEARELKPAQCRIARRVAYVCARLAVRTGRTSEAVAALRRLFSIAPRTSLWVPGKPVFASIRRNIHELLNELRAESDAQVHRLLEEAQRVRTEIAALCGEKGRDLTREIDATLDQVRVLRAGPRYSDAVDAERAARQALGRGWTALGQACDLCLNESRAEAARLSAEVEEAEARARQAQSEYGGRGILVWYLSSFVYMGLGFLLGSTIDRTVLWLMQPRTAQEMRNATGLATFVGLVLVVGSAILTGWLTMRWFRRRAGNRFRQAAARASREHDVTKKRIAELSARKEHALEQESEKPYRVESLPTSR